MGDEELFELDRAGFIPGPNEGEREFRSRVEKAKKRFEEGQWICPAHWDWAHERLLQLFHVKPLYICAYYGEDGLAPWQGAASWIEGRSLHSIQLRRSLARGSHLWLYSRDEILSHEAVHAARSGFDESRYEEFFAYMTSEKRWRRVLGPIIKRPWEVWPFLIASVAAIFWESAFFGSLLWMVLGLGRLILRHRTLNRAAAKVLKEVGDERRVRAILFRLTDGEIEAFARGAKVADYAKKRHDLRWKVLAHYANGGQMALARQSQIKA